MCWVNVCVSWGVCVSICVCVSVCSFNAISLLPLRRKLILHHSRGKGPGKGWTVVGGIVVEGVNGR